MASDVPRAELEKLRAQLMRDKDIHAANVNAAAGGIQVLDLLLADPPAADEPKPEVKDGE